jgi:hypothetical protein
MISRSDCQRLDAKAEQTGSDLQLYNLPARN